MTDIFSKSKRSQIMASISGKETRPEIIVRKLLFSQGFRFRKNVKTLPGKPDVVLPKYNTVVLIHGCFWHGHANCSKGTTLPASNTQFWKTKIQKNIARDILVKKELRKNGWQVLTVWECELNNRIKLNRTIEKLIRKIQVQSR